MGSSRVFAEETFPVAISHFICRVSCCQHSKMLFSHLQSKGVLAAVVRPGKQDREEDFRGAQEADGDVGGRLQGEIRQARERPADVWSSFLLSQGEAFYIF